MYVKGCSLGDKYKHLQTGHIWEVVEYNGEPVFIDTEYGDISEYIDEDFFEKINCFVRNQQNTLLSGCSGSKFIKNYRFGNYLL